MAALAFYRARGTWLDRAIRWRTRSEYSHVEIVIGPHWYSSSPRDGGVRRAEIVPQAGHWDFVPVELDVEHVIQLWARTAWERYDWLGIAGHAVGVPRIHCRSRWTCSEWVAAALQLSRPYRWTPADLWAWAQTKKPAQGRASIAKARDPIVHSGMNSTNGKGPPSGRP